MGDKPTLDWPIIGFTRSGRPLYPIAGAQDDPAGDGDGSDDKSGKGDGGDDSAGDGKGTDTGTEPDYKAEAEKWRELARKHEGRAKTNAEAAKELQKLKDADKTETEKLSERAAAAEQKAADAEGRALRLEVAAEKGLTPSLARRLVGATKEELEADADELLESVKPGDGKGDGKGKGPDGRVKERLRGGSEPEEEPEENDPRKLAAKVPRNE